MSCTPEPEQNLERAIAHLRDAAGKGAELVCLPELFQTQYFCQREDIALFDLAETIPGPTTEAAGRSCTRVEDHDCRVAVRAPRCRRVSQHRGHSRFRRKSRRHLPQDAYSRRSALLREVLLHAGRSRVQELRHWLRQIWHAGVLGPVVSRGRAADRSAGRERAVLSHGDRVASRREGAIWRGAVRCLAHHSARARHRQRSVCRGAEPRRL